MNILVIGSHPDDLEYGCGGTLLRFTKAGHNISLMVMTHGEAGGDLEIRKNEQMKVAAFLKAKIFWGHCSDTEIPVRKRTINDIETVINMVKPDLIFVHHPEDTHQDHRNTSQATISATRYVRNVLFYEVPTTENFQPTVFFDISSSIKEKMVLLSTHKSQVHSTRIAELSILESAKACAVFRGFQNRVKYSEGFVPLRLALGFLLHL